MNLPQILTGDLTRRFRTARAIDIGTKLNTKVDKRNKAVKNKCSAFTGDLPSRGKHWLVINESLPDLTHGLIKDKAEYDGSTLLLLDLTSITSERTITLQWPQIDAFLPIHILPAKKDFPRVTKNGLYQNDEELMVSLKSLSSKSQPITDLMSAARLRSTLMQTK
eukprot:TRINITY_DN5324_c0_g2_i1.p1 TRINITY_DN5324_c0_g2~~TRINITY_DN5324_c0_g2_i1.p1  ORF type:complete len:165 (-),score=3.41 TRINITY_DN5324_c0_g2_i1:40-534(-)